MLVVFTLCCCCVNPIMLAMPLYSRPSCIQAACSLLTSPCSGETCKELVHLLQPSTNPQCKICQSVLFRQCNGLTGVVGADKGLLLHVNMCCHMS